MLSTYLSQKRVFFQGGAPGKQPSFPYTIVAVYFCCNFLWLFVRPYDIVDKKNGQPFRTPIGYGVALAHSRLSAWPNKSVRSRTLSLICRNARRSGSVVWSPRGIGLLRRWTSINNREHDRNTFASKHLHVFPVCMMTPHSPTNYDHCDIVCPNTHMETDAQVNTTK